MYTPIADRYNPFLNQVDLREPNPYNISIVGWEGDECSVIVAMRGTFYARMGEVWCRFGIADETGPLRWENHSGYLPCLVTSFRRGDVDVEIAHFCNKVSISGADYSVLYSRVKKTNRGTEAVHLPADPNTKLIRLNEEPGPIPPGQTQVEDFVTAVDRFGKDVPWPDSRSLIGAGSWDDNFEQMREYWNGRLAKLVQFEKLPDQRLADAWRAGYIYQLIIMNGLQMHVGVNAYREEFSHDTVGMIVSMIQAGDLELAKKVLDAHRAPLVAPLDYPDGDYKYAWMWALYLLKTGDQEFVRSNFKVIRAIMRCSASQATGPGGIMRLSYAQDNPGYWLTDNWSMLTGLAAYRVLCERIDEKDEAAWALETYDKLFESTTRCIEDLSERTGIDYLSAFMDRAYRNRKRERPAAGWSTHFMMGRWPWEGYMLGARQEGIMLDRIDATYEFGFAMNADLLPPHAFGGWPGTCSAYNAGRGYGCLRGNRYRSEGIRAYQYMIDHAMNGPYSWWEGGGWPDPDCPWTPGEHLDKGTGSCPHAWGDSFSRKILQDSLICEFADGRVLIGRGVPEEWLEAGNQIRISNVPLQDNRRFGYHLIAKKDAVEITFSGDTPAGGIVLDLPGQPSTATADGVEFTADSEGQITVPAETRRAVLARSR